MLFGVLRIGGVTGEAFSFGPGSWGGSIFLGFENEAAWAAVGLRFYKTKKNGPFAWRFKWIYKRGYGKAYFTRKSL